ncbi:MAG TPA: hypothetical protein VKY74_02450, partial [Chloroflexia bacterium]|nr:hypothetical protein [Chloroflexia bacterium]
MDTPADHPNRPDVPDLPGAGTSASRAPARAATLPVRAAAWWPYLVATVTMVLLRWPTLSNRMLTTDEPAYLLQADRLRSITAFVFAFAYRSETKTQIGLIPYLLADLVAPHNEILLVRSLVLLALIATGCLLVALAHRFLGSPLPGLAAAGIVALFGASGSGYFVLPTILGEFFLGAKLEYFQSPFLLVAIYGLVASATRPASRPADWRLAGAGAAWALAVLIKPGAVLLGPLCLASLPFLWPRQSTPWAPWATGLLRGGLAFGLGATLPVALVLGPYLFNPPALAELRFNLIDLNGAYGAVRQEPLFVRGAAMLLGVPGMLLVLYLLVPLIARWAVRDRIPIAAGRLLGILLLAGPLVFLGYLPGQGLLHYLIPVIPLVALTATGYLYLALAALAARGRAAHARMLALVLAGLYLAIQVPVLVRYPAVAGTDYYLDADRRRFDLDGLVAYIDAHSRPSDAVWIYYDTPELNLLAGRHAASRDPQADWLTFIWAEPWFSRAAADLAAEQPPVIIGIDRPTLHFDSALPLRQVPQVGTLIGRDYRCDPQTYRGA